MTFRADDWAQRADCSLGEHQFPLADVYLGKGFTAIECFLVDWPLKQIGEFQRKSFCPFAAPWFVVQNGIFCSIFLNLRSIHVVCTTHPLVAV